MKNVEEINDALEKQINDYLKDNSEENVIEKFDASEKKYQKATKEKDTELDFLKIAETSREMTDLDCGIITTVIGKERSGVPIVGGKEGTTAGITIRDGRFKDKFKDPKEHPSQSKYSWIAQMAITAKGVEDLFNLNNNNKDIGFYTYFNKSLEQMNSSQTPEEYKKITLNFNNQLKDYVKDQNIEIEGEKLNSDEKIIKAVDTARHFAQLKLEHTHNTTISKGKEVEELIQTNLIVNSNFKTDTNTNTNTNKYDKFKNNLTGVSKKLFEQNKNNFESGEKVISSRLKNLIGAPTLCNAYMEFNHIYNTSIDTRNIKPLERIGTPNFRTAALANTKGSDAYENTRRVVEEAVEINKKVNSNSNSNSLVILNLNNTTFFDRKEKKIRKNTEEACNELLGKGDRVEYKNVPINGSSVFEYIGSKFGLGEDKKREKYEKIIDIILDAEKNNKTLLIQCKSGKDRTGYIQLLKNCIDYCEKNKDNNKGVIQDNNKVVIQDNNKKKATAILKKIIDEELISKYSQGNVQEYQAGGAGGSVGVNAIKNGGFTMTGGTEFLNKIKGGNILKTNGLDKLNNFKHKNYSNDVDIIKTVDKQNQNSNNVKLKEDFINQYKQKTEEKTVTLLKQGITLNAKLQNTANSHIAMNSSSIQNSSTHQR